MIAQEGGNMLPSVKIIKIRNNITSLLYHSLT